MEAAAREVAEVTRQVAVAGGESGSMLRLGPDQLLVRLQRYMDELLQVGGVARRKYVATANAGMIVNKNGVRSPRCQKTERSAVQRIKLVSWKGTM
jgi:hypothetical protein